MSLPEKASMESRSPAMWGQAMPSALPGLIRIRPGKAGRPIVALSYNPDRVARLKTIAGHRWHPAGQYWTVPHTDRALTHLLTLFAGEPVKVEPPLRYSRVLERRDLAHESEITQGGEQGCQDNDDLHPYAEPREKSPMDGL
jgi:hypothetical protein